MGTVRLGSFPSLDNKKLTDCIDKGVFSYFLNHFPRNFFANTYMDNQTGSSGNYNINSDGELVKIETGKKLNNPALRFNIRHGANNTTDPFGGNIWNVNQQPGAFGIDTDLTGYRPILYDPYDIKIALNERTIRTNIDFNMTFESKDDQIACCNYLDSSLKMNYVDVIYVKTFVPMHRLMMEYLRSSLFKSEINVLSKMKADTTEKQEYQKKINTLFMEHMYEFSEGHIKPYKALDPTNENTDYVYGYWQTQRVTIHFDKYDADDGDKKGNAWTNFHVSLNGWIEFGNPIGFITSVPAIVRGTKNNWYMKTSSETDRNNYYHLMKFKEVFKDTRHKLRVDERVYDCFYFEREIMMSSSVEDFNILDDVISKEDNPDHYSVMTALLSTIKDQDDFDKLFNVIIYKGDDPLDHRSYNIDKNFNFHIIGCDLTVPYYIDIFVNRLAYANKSDEMKRFLKKVGVDLNNQSVIYPGGYGSINSIMGTSVNEHTGDIVEFVRIVPSNFLVVDASFKYFVKVTEKNGDKFYPISPDNILANPDLDLYVYIDNEYILVDRNKILIPNPKLAYYIYDRGSNKFIECKNFEEFDSLQTYYLSSTEFKSGGNINIAVNGYDFDIGANSL